MAEAQSPQNPKQAIVQKLIDVGTKAFDPSSDEATRDSEHQIYDQLVKEIDTWTLLHALNALIKPDVVQPWLRLELMNTLTLVPLRSDGVRGTMELIFAVHPSNAGKAPQQDSSGKPLKQGAAITQEAVAVVTKLLSSVPTGMEADAWFYGISAQLFALMDGSAGPELARTAAQVVGFGILGKKQYGAPGSSGWNVFVRPLIEAVNPSLRAQENIEEEDADNDIIDLSKAKILVATGELSVSIQRLEVLVLSNPSPGLCKRILSRVIVQLWALVSRQYPNEAVQRTVYIPAKRLLQTYLRLFGNAESIQTLISNLTCNGSQSETSTTPAWEYTISNGGVEIAALPATNTAQSELNWSNIEHRASTLAEYIASACSVEDTSSIFLSLLRRWVDAAGKQQGSKDIQLVSQENKPSENPEDDLKQVALLQQMMTKSQDKLISHFDQLLELITQVLEADAKTPLGDEVVSVILSLLNLAVTAPTFQKSDINLTELMIVETALERLSRAEDRPDVSATARNLSLLLKYRDQLDDPNEKQGNSVSSTRKIEDRKTYNLAMSYIAGDTSNPPPIVAEGLKLLLDLISTESPILDITAVVVLLSNLLKENEDYINLQVVKMFTQLASKHPRSTLKELLDNYLDAQEKSTTDTRLRFGEALVQVIERLGETFTGEAALQTGETLLSIAGRRGYRPKTLKKQIRDERTRKLKEERKSHQRSTSAAHPSDDELEDIDDEDDEELMEQERANNDVLAQIIQGWESKRGREDVRMRTSALSILGSAMESNIRGLGAALVSASVDLCVNVLALEPELEKGILRRAAIIVILGFVRALAASRETAMPSSALGFGLTEQSRADIQRTLEYVAATDNDGLVREHARDVVESLESFRMTALLPHAAAVAGDATAAADIGSLGRLAGLRVNPDLGGSHGNGSGARPRIEEVE